MILEFAFMLGIFLIIPIGVIITAGLIKYNEKIKKIIMFILASVYNFIFGLLDGMVFVILTLCFLSGELSSFIVGIVGVIIYLLFFLPLNIFMKKTGKINIIVYIVMIILIKITAISLFINTTQGTFDL